MPWHATCSPDVECHCASTCLLRSCAKPLREEKKKLGATGIFTGLAASIAERAQVGSNFYGTVQVERPWILRCNNEIIENICHHLACHWCTDSIDASGHQLTLLELLRTAAKGLWSASLSTPLLHRAKRWSPRSAGRCVRLLLTRWSARPPRAAPSAGCSAGASRWSSAPRPPAPG